MTDFQHIPELYRSRNRRHRRGAHVLWQNERYDHSDPFVGDFDSSVDFSSEGGLSDVSGDLLGNGQIISDANLTFAQQDDNAYASGNIESGFDTRMRFYEWGSTDDDSARDWGEGDDEDNTSNSREEIQEPEGNFGAQYMSEHTYHQRWFRSWRTRRRLLYRHQRQAMDGDFNLHDYIPSPFQNTDEYSIDESFELGVFPGDYIDARGFEHFLNDMVEPGHVRRGAPPAAASAIENLPLIIIDNSHADESPACAICKDSLEDGNEANQLPCLHLYHPDCILPWLRTRNSCPICRYELPTDDQAYEEQKQQMGNTIMLHYRDESSSEENAFELSAGTDGSDQGLDIQSLADLGFEERRDRARSSTSNDNGIREFESLVTDSDAEGETGSKLLSFATANKLGTSQTSWKYRITSTIGLVLSSILRLIAVFLSFSASSRSFQTNRQHQQLPRPTTPVIQNKYKKRRWWRFLS
eukprot:TRINITY_DN851_c0_g1_i2.p1 TRINITY_DN851_c0_g1~~TRINITY_DN851_c0_g1_i2.p1  ORF type:complete len:469 (+),score=91.04 TRINITY_DN851_c0_g1_i2:133-1539(+)